MKKLIVGFVAGALMASTAIVLAQTAKVFPDVPKDSYYAAAVDYMSSLGVINGYDNGNFGPGDGVNRAQAAVMFQRYDDTIKLLVDDYCTNHKLQMGMMATKYYQDMCINRGYSAYATPAQ